MDSRLSCISTRLKEVDKEISDLEWQGKVYFIDGDVPDSGWVGRDKHG